MKQGTRSIWALSVGLVLVLAFGVVAGLASPKGETANQSPADQTQPDDFDQRIREYILQNPEVIVEAIQRWQQRQRAVQADQIKAVVASQGEEIFNDPESPVGGNPEGDVTLVEFFDYNCPYCRKVAPVINQIERDDPGLRFVYKEFPVLGPDSVFAARAALASRKQGKYVAFHKAMMQAGERLTEGKVMEIAKKVGLDAKRLKADMGDPAIKTALERNHELANALRITGTPSFVIGTEILGGAADIGTIKGLIDRARQELKDKAPQR